MNFSPSIQAKDRLGSICLPVIKPFLPERTDCWTSEVSPPERKLQKGRTSPNIFCRLKCLFYSCAILKLKQFGPDSQICPDVHAGVMPQISVGLLLLHICTSGSTNRTIIGLKFTWFSFTLMSQYRVTAISYPPRVWLCFKNPK